MTRKRLYALNDMRVALGTWEVTRDPHPGSFKKFENRWSSAISLISFHVFPLSFVYFKMDRRHVSAGLPRL